MPVGITNKESNMDDEADDFVSLLMRAGRVRSLEHFVDRVAALRLGYTGSARENIQRIAREAQALVDSRER